MITKQTDRLKRAHKHEIFVRELLGEVYPNVRLQPGSGNKADAPNDVKAPGECMVEAKCAFKDLIGVKLSWLRRAKQLAAQFGLPSFLAIRYYSGGHSHDYFVIEADQMLQFLKLAHENEELRAAHDALAR